MWDVLNSAFALWFLSSVVVASITAAFTWYKKKQSEQSEKAATQRRLDIEIGNRIAEGLVALRLDQTDFAHGSENYSGAMYNKAIAYLDNRFKEPHEKALDFSVYPTYRGRGFRSLLYELSAVVPPAEFPELRKAKATYDRLVNLADIACRAEQGSPPIDMKKTLSALKEAIVVLESLQAYAHWKSQL